ncbi:MAG TPA: bifunctional (p)ppGpp synthetase/guanosine-3',5'-bis(diphosphate) 3'-pyrophosphohydrolase [Oligoflexia bacterium]|nr:bifunctional (p)ppGpp synthetase/guanosine-3',5'-bis(diphosphate) 3'-pyrophosphohydrolase [Oligoflexia bacterium]
MELQKIIAAVQEYHPRPDIELIRKAHAFAIRYHKGQTRVSGEPYITHLLEVAFLATKLKLDSSSIATSLLHDSVEDTSATLDEIEKEFGKDVSLLVDGVTKLSQIQFSSSAEAQAENFRKMLLAMAKDIRVLLVKLCDRVHNMRTLEFLSESRRFRIAQETLDIYAPLAHRLGIFWIKSELEDLCLKYLKPAIFENIVKQIHQSKREREYYIKEVVKLINKVLEENSIQGDVSGRPKHIFSIYEKMARQNLPFNEIYDLIAFRIIVPTTMDCYAALGVVHAAWKPIPGRFKDYIAMPKPNHYQSLHTTVIGPENHRVEIQIRTQAMHETAERGIAAHWAYKETGDSKSVDPSMTFQFGWLKDLIESEKLLRDPVEFLSTVKADLFPQDVFVFSPKGDVIALTQGATPIDFAFAIHSEVGKHCAGARVNGQQVPLAYKLQNGDTIEIVTADSQVPSKDWLSIVATSKAKQRIRSWLRAEERSRSISIGRELLSKDLRKVGLSLSKVSKDNALKKIASDFGLRDEDLLLAEIGYGKISTRSIVGRLVPDASDLEAKLQQEESALQKIFQKAARAFRDRSGIKVKGIDDVVCRFAKCCEPLPGDELVGYVTRGRGVAVHARGCPQTLVLDPRRMIEVTWDDKAKTPRAVKIRVYCLDQVGILAALTQTISSIGSNIVNAHVSSTLDGRAMCSFELTVDSASQFRLITRKLEDTKGVIRVERHKRGMEEL